LNIYGTVRGWPIIVAEERPMSAHKSGAEIRRMVEDRVKEEEKSYPTKKACVREIKDRHLTELGNAERFADLFHDQVKYCHPWSRWLINDGPRWKADDSGEIYRMGKFMVRGLLREASQTDDEDRRKALTKWAFRSEQKAVLRNSIDLAASELPLPVRPEELDSDPLKFNCLNGTYHLKGDKLWKHDPADLITMIAGAEFVDEAKCPKWLDHLALVMGGDAELIEFLQRAWGSCLTGLTDDRNIFILYGTGRNGKSICIETIASILGDYARRTPTSTLLLQKHEQIPNDLARLKGARFVYASEVEKGKALAESMIKDITGGERISARFMRGEWFEFKPQFKLWLSTNYLPRIYGSDDAIWDRLCLIPFNVRIPDNLLRDRREVLKDLKKESDGILRWLITGVQRWYFQGLNPPSKVQRAVTGLREEMDTISDFFSCEYVFETDGFASTHGLSINYDEYCQGNGVKPLPMHVLRRELRHRGCEPGKRNHERGWLGIRPKTSGEKFEEEV
jgi:putative DNA primase/helicase